MFLFCIKTNFDRPDPTRIEGELLKAQNCICDQPRSPLLQPCGDVESLWRWSNVGRGGETTTETRHCTIVGRLSETGTDPQWLSVRLSKHSSQKIKELILIYNCTSRPN